VAYLEGIPRALEGDGWIPEGEGTVPGGDGTVPLGDRERPLVGPRGPLLRPTDKREGPARPLFRPRAHLEDPQLRLGDRQREVLRPRRGAGGASGPLFRPGKHLDAPDVKPPRLTGRRRESRSSGERSEGARPPLSHPSGAGGRDVPARFSTAQAVSFGGHALPETQDRKKQVAPKPFTRSGDVCGLGEGGCPAFSGLPALG
jgi:hypothetical protein